MKAERVIRSYRDDLRELAHGPCPVCGKHHDDEGHEHNLGRMAMLVAERALSWALDEQPEDDYAIERLAEAASEARALRRVKKGGSLR